MIRAGECKQGADMVKILLVDDDADLVSMLTEYLEQEGFDVTSAADGEAGVAAALTARYDIAVLDVMMPGMSGLEALRRIRTRTNLPVLMLTARGDDMDRIVGLELGADDYVPKPCMPRELTARLRAILRRAQPAGPGEAPSSAIVAGRLAVFPEKRRVEWDGMPVSLTSTEYNLVEILAYHAGRPVSKRDLAEFGLGRALSRFDRSIDVHLSSIRQKLGTLKDGRSCIQTVYRLGYQLIKD